VSARVVLVGLPGVGKSTVGRALALALGVPFVDVDDEVRRRSGTDPAVFLRTHGEAAFRKEEEAAVTEVLARPGDLVVATGGGTIETPACRALLAREPLVVQLVATSAQLVARLGDGASRPLVASPTIERLDALAARRGQWYDEVSDVVVEAEGPVDALVAKLCTIAVPA
jgi:shikimate kinase